MQKGKALFGRFQTANLIALLGEIDPEHLAKFGVIINKPHFCSFSHGL
jgi:hypothetical protein